MMKRLAILTALLLSLPLFAAEKRRSVGVPDVASGPPVTITCKGTVTDAATGLPVAFATITTDKGKRAYASRLGTFAFKLVTTNADVGLTASRTGYDSSATVRISGDGTHEVNFRLQGRPAIALQKSDGTIIALDDDSLKFGYVVPFIGYQTETGTDFYLTDGTRAKIPFAQMTRITGLGTSVPNSYCQRPAQRVLLELRDTTIHDATFIDACYGYTVDLIARDHVTGDVVYLPFSEVTELVFP